MSKTYDLVVIGGGPGGYVAAIRGAQLGMKAAVIERDRLGGICLNWGCIPSKALLTNARIYQQMQNADRWGISVSDLKFDMSKIVGRSREVADSISKGVAYLMRKNKIDVINGSARFRKDGSLSILDGNDKETQTVQAEHTILATGARARAIPGVEIDRKKIVTYKEALLLEEVPRSMVIIGAGAIGVEFAYFFRAFGAEITLIEMENRLLPLEDAEISQELAKSFKKLGINLLLDSKVAEAKTGKDGVRVTVQTKGKEREAVQADVVLNAVGVVANVENLNLAEIGVEIERGHIKVDSWYRTNVDGIYAIGDVIGPPFLAHVASHEGIICAEKIAGAKTYRLDYGLVPNCTYCQPQVASVGLSEHHAKERGYQVKAGKFPFQVLGKAKASQATEGFVKLIFDDQYGELLGAHIIGEEATEMIMELVMAKTLEATREGISRAIHPHPTLSEAIMEAAAAAHGEPIHL